MSSEARSPVVQQREQVEDPDTADPTRMSSLEYREAWHLLGFPDEQASSSEMSELRIA